MTKIYKKVTVVLTKELIIGIDQDCLTPEFLEHHSKYFHAVDTPDEIFETTGDQYVRCSETFIEGVGAVTNWEEEGSVEVKEIDEWTDIEIEDCVKE